MNITNLKIKGGNFAMVLSGTIAEDKLQSVVDDGISYIAERGGLSKVFKGVKDRKTVAFSADMVASVASKMKEAFKGIVDDLTVDVSAREWSEGAGGAQAKAQAAYDEMIAMGLTAEQAAQVARKVHATWTLPAIIAAEKDADKGGETAGTEQTDEPMEG